MSIYDHIKIINDGQRASEWRSGPTSEDKQSYCSACKCDNHCICNVPPCCTEAVKKATRVLLEAIRKQQVSIRFAGRSPVDVRSDMLDVIDNKIKELED